MNRISQAWIQPGKYQSMNRTVIALSLLLGLLLLALFARISFNALHAAPSFDGAMNMEVSNSIAHGEGYRRSYAAREAFPHEIQTGAPYILPTALVFRLWGVGLTQAQIINIAYLALLLAATYLLVELQGGRLLALFAACTVIVVPGLQNFGFGGYGEIPALALAFAATAIYFRNSRTQSMASGFAAGIVLALAVITKTVMLIGAGAICLCIILEFFCNDDERTARLKRIAAFAGGGALTLLAMEIWRLISLGGVGALKTWWYAEASGIFMQAGVRPGFQKLSGSLGEKLLIHIDYLSHDYRLAIWIVVLWLVLLCLACVATLLRPSQRRGKWSTFAVLLTALVYMLWWLVVTPTAKTWHRRIIDGMICADVGLIMFAAAWLRDAQLQPRPAWSTALMRSLAALTLAIPMVWLVKDSRMLWATVADTDHGGLEEVAQQIRSLPQNAYIFGVGWYSAPRLGLLSERPILDFYDLPVSRMERSRPIYFLAEPVNPEATWGRLRTTYGLPAPPAHRFAVMHVSALVPKPFEDRHMPVLRHIAAGENYQYMRGFNKPEGANGRWLSDDNLTLLTPQEGDRFELTVNALPVSSYIYKSAPQVLVSFNGCEAPPQATRPDSEVTLSFEIPAHCQVVAGNPVSIRIEVDNILATAVTVDPRPLAILAKSMGFVSAASPPPQSAPSSADAQ